MSFLRPTLAALVERARLDVESWIDGASARLRRQLLDVLVRMHAGAMSALYGKAEWTSRQILPDTADSDNLARHAGVSGLTRKAAFAGTGNVRFTGVAATAIPAGTVLVATGGIQYQTSGAAVMGGGGFIVVAVEAVEVGAIAAINEGATLTLASPIAGVTSTAVVQAGGLTPGGAEETDDALLGRLLLRIQTPPQGGSKDDYLDWALPLDGVTRAWVYPLWLGPGTVGLTFAMDDRVNPIPTGPDVATVQAALDVLRPVTAALTVFAPVAQAINLTISLVPSTAEVRAAVLAELADMFRRDGEPGGILRRSRISEAISIAAGETYHVLTVPAADIALDPGKLPVLGVVTWA